MTSIPRKFARFVFGRLMPQRPYPVLFGPLKGARVILGSLAGEGGGASAYFNRVEPEQTAAFAGHIRPGDIFFDIGANVGYYTLLAARLAGPEGRVVAVEPLGRNIEYLRRHLKLNKVRNVTVIEAACSDTDATAIFRPGANAAMGRIIGAGGGVNESEDHDEGRGDQAPEALEVPTMTLTSISQQTGLEPDAIKIDVEGAELEVLKGGLSLIEGSMPLIFLSTHSRELRDECLALLNGLGYDAKPLGSEKDPFEFFLTPA